MRLAAVGNGNDLRTKLQLHMQIVISLQVNETCTVGSNSSNKLHELTIEIE